ncbi:MAG TPA: MBL fold metallo-hydrolase [Candidatus Saccharimonadales bacterium]|nr:MBL fold metallo-hydrolase [Candidatus Saccharimonadales bacterium]
MEIERKGGNCVVISYKKADFVVDPKLSMYGLKDQGANAAAILLTQPDFGVAGSEGTVVISGPGEYEVNNCSVRGIPSVPHSQPDGSPQTATIYRLDIDDYSVAILGHVHAKLSEEVLETIGVVDILVLPVGGYGYTLEPKEAVDVVRAIEPKTVIPTHYDEDGIKFEVPQAPLSEFLKELGATAAEAVPKLKLKAGTLPEVLTVYELTRTK